MLLQELQKQQLLLPKMLLLMLPELQEPKLLLPKMLLPEKLPIVTVYPHRGHYLMAVVGVNFTDSIINIHTPFPVITYIRRLVLTVNPIR